MNAGSSSGMPRPEPEKSSRSSMGSSFFESQLLSCSQNERFHRAERYSDHLGRLGMGELVAQTKNERRALLGSQPREQGLELKRGSDTHGARRLSFLVQRHRLGALAADRLEKLPMRDRVQP